jgi:protein-S-isoprenylcysteine O-methyltransferase Ste14
MSQYLELFTTVYNLSPIPLRFSYGFWGALMIVYWYAHMHDRYNVRPKARVLEEKNFNASLPFIGIANVIFYWIAQNHKYWWHIENMLAPELATSTGFCTMAYGLYVILKGRAAINGYWGPHLYLYSDPNDRKIIQHGIYSKIRHPIYFGQVLMAFGTFLLANTPTFLIFPIAVSIWNTVRARKESRFLKAHYGTVFDDYRKKTPFRAISGII